jgi:hypothetical protein
MRKEAPLALKVNDKWRLSWCARRSDQHVSVSAAGAATLPHDE